MCESESGFKAFGAGFGFGFRPKKAESGFGFKKNKVDSDSNPDSNFCLSVTPLLRKKLLHASNSPDSQGIRRQVGFESGFGFKPMGFRFGFKKIEVDSDSSGFGFEVIRPVQFARPTSGTNNFESRTSLFCSQQVPLTCLVISRLPLDSQKSMTYRFVSTFHDESISFVRIIVGSLIKK